MNLTGTQLITALRSDDVVLVLNGASVTIDRLVRSSGSATFSGYDNDTYADVTITVATADLDTPRFTRA